MPKMDRKQLKSFRQTFVHHGFSPNLKWVKAISNFDSPRFRSQSIQTPMNPNFLCFGTCYPYPSSVVKVLLCGQGLLRRFFVPKKQKL